MSFKFVSLNHNYNNLVQNGCLKNEFSFNPISSHYIRWNPLSYPFLKPSLVATLRDPCFWLSELAHMSMSSHLPLPKGGASFELCRIYVLSALKVQPCACVCILLGAVCVASVCGQWVCVCEYGTISFCADYYGCRSAV